MKPEKLTIQERAILANQFKILSILEPDNSGDYQNKVHILEEGYEGMYSDLFSNIRAEGVPKQVTEEVFRILDMYRAIENGVARLSGKDKEALALDRIKFEGFDGNNDPHYHFMVFIVEKMELYDEYQDKALNSHTSSSIGKYRRMLRAFNERYKPMDGLSKEDIDTIIQAARH